MSLTFQSGESIKQALYEELQNILNPITEVRVAAEGRMKQLEYTEGYGVFLSEIIMNQSFELAMRQLASVMLTRYVEEHWSKFENDVSVVATDQAKRMIRSILPNGLYDPNSKIRTSVAYTISTIATIDWPNTWTELFDIIVKCLGGNEDSIHGAMQVLIEFTYDLDSQIGVVGPIIISEVYRIFEAEQVYSVKTRTCAVKIFKSLFKSINEHIESKEKQEEILNPILPGLIEKLIYSLSNPNGRLSSVTLKTEIIKVFEYLVNEMPKFLQQFTTQILPPIWQLLTQTADIYVKVVVNQTEPNPFPDNDDEDELANFNTMILQIIEFIHSLVERGKFKSAIKAVLADLIYIMIVYMQITEDQIGQWSDDPEQFVNDDYQEEIMDGTVRTSSHDVLQNIESEFGGKVLPAFSEALTRHINVAEAEKSSGSPYWWKIHEASIMAVGTYRGLIVEREGKFDFSQYLNYVQNLMSSDIPSPYLISRCLWVLSRFASSAMFTKEMLDVILNAIQSSLGEDKPLNLRIYAVRSIYELCESLKDSNDDKRALTVSKLAVFVEGIMAIVPLGKSSVLSLVLETLTLIVSFDGNIAAAAQNKIISLTIAVFLKYHDDPYLLEHVQDMLKMLCQNPFCLQPLQERIVPTLVSILNLQGEMANSTMQDISLDVLQTIVKYSTAPLSDQLILNAFPAAIHCILHTDDHSIMQSGGECLRAYIFVAPEQVCSYRNGEGLNYIMQVITMLLNPMNTEYSAVFVGRLVITVISKAASMLGENVYLILKAVISKMQLVESLSVAMSLILTFAHLFISQMDALLNFLSTVPGPTGEPAIQYVFSQWLCRQQMFYGAYERKVSTMALCKLLEHGVTTKDVRLTSVTIRDKVEGNGKGRTRSQTSGAEVQWTNVPILVKMFKLLINELAFLKESNAVETDSESESESTENTEKDTITRSKATPIKLVSDIMYNDDYGDDSNDQLMQELMQDPAFDINMEENLTKFLQNFSRDDNFSEFTQHLTQLEKVILQEIQVSVA